MELAFPDRLASQFKLSDILGYLAPGAGFLIGVFGFERWAHHVIKTKMVHLPFNTAFNLMLGTRQAKEEWFVYLSVAALGLLVIYITGHIIDSVAVLFLDRLLIYKAYGYPYEGLLLSDREQRARHHPLSNQPRAFSRAYYRGMFFWTNTYLALRCLCFVARATPTESWFQSALLWTTRVLAVFLVVAFIFKILIVPIRRHYMRGHEGTPSTEPKLVTWLIQAFGWVLAGPWELIVGKPLSNLINSRRSFDAEFREMYATLFRETFGLDPNTAESNNYWMSYSYLVSHSPKLAAVAAHWEMMYTFSRNLGVAFYLSFLYALCWLQLEVVGVPLTAPGTTILTALPCFLLLLSASLLLNHYYLYVSYYSKFLYRAFVFLAHTHRTRPVITTQ